jgi:hypothetical protein
VPSFSILIDVAGGIAQARKVPMSAASSSSTANRNEQPIHQLVDTLAAEGLNPADIIWQLTVARPNFPRAELLDLGLHAVALFRQAEDLAQRAQTVAAVFDQISGITMPEIADTIRLEGGDP